MNITKHSEDYFTFKTLYIHFKTLYITHIFLSCAAAAVVTVLSSTMRSRDTEWKCKPNLCALCGPLFWSPMQAAGLKAQSLKQECYRWSRSFLENWTCCLEQTFCYLICVWCKIETVLDASFVLETQNIIHNNLQQKMLKGKLYLTVYGMVLNCFESGIYSRFAARGELAAVVGKSYLSCDFNTR